VTTIEKKTDEIFGRACPDRIIIYIINEKKKMICENCRIIQIVLLVIKESERAQS